MNPRRRFALAAALLAALPTLALAQAYPARPVTVIVPYPPGGATDVLARVMAEKLSTALGQAFIVENKAGAGGNLGAKAASIAKPDGYTLLMGAVTAHSISMTLTPQTAGYDIDKDFAPITMVGAVPLMIVVNPKVPAASLKDFVALAKAKPNTITVASAGNGTTQHLGSELFKLMTRTEMIHVPYKGSGPAISDLLGGQVDATFETGPAALTQVKAGKLKVLATATAQRTLPGTPTASEAGVHGFEVAATYGVLAPAGTPKPIVERLNAEIGKALALPDVKVKFEQQGVIPTHMTPEQTTQHIRGEVSKWGKVIREAKVTAD
jgi:tripartite-type tricarboxylate transporter receptor subunit TctC